MQARIAEDSAKIIQDPNTPLDEALHKLRLQNYKARFLGRHGHLSAPPMLRLPPNAGASNASATASANTTAAGGIGAGDMTGVETNTGQQGGTLGALSVDVKTEPGTDGGDTESTQSVGRRRRAASIVASTHIKRAAGLVGGESDDEESQLAQAVSKPRLAGRGTGGSAGRPFARAPQVRATCSHPTAQTCLHQHRRSYNRLGSDDAPSHTCSSKQVHAGPPSIECVL